MATHDIPVDACPKCGKSFSLYVEYAYGSIERYDGVSERVCKPCDIRVGRWSGKILKDGEVEVRYGEGDPYVPDDCKCGNQKNPKYPTCFACSIS